MVTIKKVKAVDTRAFDSGRIAWRGGHEYLLKTDSYNTRWLYEIPQEEIPNFMKRGIGLLYTFGPDDDIDEMFEEVADVLDSGD